jgi:LPS sulfotransferase NodH
MTNDEFRVELRRALEDYFSDFKIDDVPFTTSIILHLRRTAELEESVRKIKSDIYGNGKEGIKTIQIRQSADIDQIKEFIEEIKSYQRWFILLLLGTLITSLLGLIIK